MISVCACVCKIVPSERWDIRSVWSRKIKGAGQRKYYLWGQSIAPSSRCSGRSWSGGSSPRGSEGSFHGRFARRGLCDSPWPRSFAQSLARSHSARTACTHTYIHTYIHAGIHIHTYTHIHIHTHAYIHTYRYLSIPYMHAWFVYWIIILRPNLLA
jgi:hypothetical protein